MRWAQGTGARALRRLRQAHGSEPSLLALDLDGEGQFEGFNPDCHQRLQEECGCEGAAAELRVYVAARVVQSHFSQLSLKLSLTHVGKRQVSTNDVGCHPLPTIFVRRH